MGDVIDIPAIQVTDGLSGRNQMMVNYVVGNASFDVDSPHPANMLLASFYGGMENVPHGARVRDLLQAWGSSYNAQLSEDSPRRLSAIRLDEYEWPGGTFTHYRKFKRSWRTEL